jgi:peptidoglycan/LPS O-acetylase OafA/YrhL
VTDGYLGVGWSMVDGGLWTGLVRMLFPYTMGMLMARMFHPVKGARGVFWICGLIIFLVGCLPLLFGELSPWLNGLYDALCVILVFPCLVWLGASQLSIGNLTHRVSHFLGELSYPLYAVHYPLMYLFYAHIGFDGDLVSITVLNDVWPVALALPLACILLAWLSWRF